MQLPETFLAGKKEFGSFYGYHGSPSQNFHSIIHRGLICSLNVVGAYGYGTYLTSDLDTSKSYAMKYMQSRYQSQTNNNQSTGNSLNLAHATGNSYCIAIVEVVNHPSIKTVDAGVTYRSGDTIATKYYVVDRDEFMQLRNLLVFENDQGYNYY